MGVAAVARAVFLDRDGVLNQVVFRNGLQGSPRTLNELVIAPEARAALARLKEAGFLLICVTNQPEVPRGLLSRQALEDINSAVRTALPLDDLLVCCHQDNDGCECRKPKPGLLFQSAREHGIDLSSSFMVGDRWRDVEAGATAGCRTLLLENDYDDRTPSTPPDATVQTLTAAVDWILDQAGSA
ncbi:MAG: D-glycero-alpha-D-manno-heptose-1,7-bisphosphate 7-phosphatase [Chloroflexota bacterium]